jgi:NAD(P)H-dependent FMN reductase
MRKIIILSASVRIARQSNHVALYFKNHLQQIENIEVELIDLKELNFPIFDERLSFQQNPSDKLRTFAQKIERADAVIIVSPEYNGSFPASLKNAVDVLYKEWYRKPIGIVGVSSGNFGGVNMIIALQSLFLRIKAIPSSTNFPIPNVQNQFDENGQAKDPENTGKRASSFLQELFWIIDTNTKN